MSAGREGGMAVPLVPACEKQNSEERSLALWQKTLCVTLHWFPTVSQSLPFLFLRTSEIILTLLCMANSSSDLQACHLKLVWVHPSENSKQHYLSISSALLHPTRLRLLLCMQHGHPAWVLEHRSSLFCLHLLPPCTKLTGGFFTSSLSFFLFD